MSGKASNRRKRCRGQNGIYTSSLRVILNVSSYK